MILAAALLMLAGTADVETVFLDHCLSPFPEADRFEQAIESNELGLERQEGRQSAQLWSDGIVSLAFATEYDLPAGMPAPQCRVSAEVASGFDHLAAAGRIGDTAGQGRGKSTGKAGNNKTQWDWEDEWGRHLRMFLTSRPSDGGAFAVSITLMQLKDG